MAPPARLANDDDDGRPERAPELVVCASWWWLASPSVWRAHSRRVQSVIAGTRLSVPAGPNCVSVFVCDVQSAGSLLVVAGRQHDGGASGPARRLTKTGPRSFVRLAVVYQTVGSVRRARASSARVQKNGAPTNWQLSRAPKPIRVFLPLRLRFGTAAPMPVSPRPLPLSSSSAS